MHTAIRAHVNVHVNYLRLHLHLHQTLTQHATACMQHRCHAEHGPKACMVQKRDKHGTGPHTGRAPQPQGARRRGGGAANNAKVGTQQQARGPREGGGKGGEWQGNGGSTEEVTAVEGGAGEVDTALGWQWGRPIPGDGGAEGRGEEETLAAHIARVITRMHTCRAARWPHHAYIHVSM